MANPTTNFLEYYKACQNDLLTKYQTYLSDPKYYSKYDVTLKVLQRGNLTLTKFKYEDNCKFSYLWQMVSRGTTIIKNRDRLMPIFGLNKFFNAHEFEKMYGTSFDNFILSLQSQGFKFIFMPKYDGSYIQCFTDEAGTKHRHTLGSLEKNKIGKSLSTYHDVANNLLNQQFPKLYDFLEANQGFSLVCEIITPDNYIKTLYDFTDNSTGILKPLVIIRPDGIPTFDNLHEYISSNKWEFTYENLNEVKTLAIGQLETMPATFGIHPEGLVAYAYKDNICFPIAKIKRLEYINFDETEELEKLCNLQIAKIEGKIDDIPLTQNQQKHINEFTYYLDKLAESFAKLDFLTNMPNFTQRQYASCINALPPNLQAYSDGLFKLRKNGFEFVSGYDAVIKLLNLEIIDGPNKLKLIKTFHLKYGHNWFKKV